MEKKFCDNCGKLIEQDSVYVSYGKWGFLKPDFGHRDFCSFICANKFTRAMIKKYNERR